MSLIAFVFVVVVAAKIETRLRLELKRFSSAQELRQSKIIGQQTKWWKQRDHDFPSDDGFEPSGLDSALPGAEMQKRELRDEKCRIEFEQVQSVITDCTLACGNAVPAMTLDVCFSFMNKKIKVTSWHGSTTFDRHGKRASTMTPDCYNITEFLAFGKLFSAESAVLLFACLIGLLHGS